MDRGREFVNFRQGDMTMTQYAAILTKLSYFALMYALNLADRAQTFEDGLREKSRS